MNSRTKHIRLVTLTFLSASLCWLPIIMMPGLDLSVWLPLTCVALSSALCAFLNREHWRLFIVSSITASFGGLCISYPLWPRIQKAAVAIPLFVTLGTVATAIVVLPSAFVGSRLSVRHHTLHNAAWFALIMTAAFGPTCLALTPSFVARRVARNEQIAADRFTSLQRAVERTFGARFDRAEICDGSILKQNYSGPPFTDEDWRRITGNYVKQGGICS